MVELFLNFFMNRLAVGRSYFSFERRRRWVAALSLLWGGFHFPEQLFFVLVFVAFGVQGQLPERKVALHTVLGVPVGSVLELEGLPGVQELIQLLQARGLELLRVPLGGNPADVLAGGHRALQFHAAHHIGRTQHLLPVQLGHHDVEVETDVVCDQTPNVVGLDVRLELLQHRVQGVPVQAGVFVRDPVNLGDLLGDLEPLGANGECLLHLYLLTVAHDPADLHQPGRVILCRIGVAVVVVPPTSLRKTGRLGVDENCSHCVMYVSLLTFSIFL